MLTKNFAAAALCCLFAVSAVAQESAVEKTTAVEKTVTAKKAVTDNKAAKNIKVMLTKDGALEGKAVRTGTDQVAANVKVSLSADGKVVDAVESDEKGNFSFASVAPGVYQVLGAADGFVGSAAYDVVGYDSGSSCSACSLGVAPVSSEIVYDNYSSAPVSSFSGGCSICGSCNTCGGGLGGGSIGGGGGRLLGGRLGGGLLNGRIGLVGLAGLAGLAGIDDASPDQ